MVADIITGKRDEIAALCREYRIRALWLFGSAATEHFDPKNSDIDLHVEFGEYDETVVVRYLSLAERLETLLGLDVVLISSGGLRFRHVLKNHLQETRTQLYG